MNQQVTENTPPGNKSQKADPQSASVEAQTLYAKAQEAFQAKDVDLAKEHLSRCIMQYKNFMPAYLMLVDILCGQGFDPKAWDLDSAWSILMAAHAVFGEAPELMSRLEGVQNQKYQKHALALSEPRWAEFKNKHKGQRCVIVGNGPSLNDMDLSFLKNEIVFGLNRIYLGFEKFGFTPDYLVAANKFVIQQSAADFRALPMTKFISMEGVPAVSANEDTIIMNPRHYRDFFSSDPRDGICIGSTVTYCAMQLAYFMGFDTVVLIGVDHKFETKGTAHTLVESQGEDPNHFDANYFGKGYKWQLPDLAGSEQMYRIADAQFRAYRNKVIDATWGGHCDVFEKVDYRQYFLPKKFEREVTDLVRREKIRPFKNKHEGERVFIVGNGPSLKNTPMDLIKNEQSFAMNRISLLYPNTQWRPSHFVCTTTNAYLPDWNKDIRESIDLGIPSIVWKDLCRALPNKKNIIPISCGVGEVETDTVPDEWWADDLEEKVCKFGTSLLVAVQAAVYMGYKEIYLLGCDLGFKDSSDGKDANHFNSDYGTPGYDAEILNMNMLAAHKLIKRICDKKGIQIFNATVGGSLEVYPRVKLEEVVKHAPKKKVVSETITSVCEGRKSFIELLDPKDIDGWAYDQGNLAEIREFSLLPGKRIGWNYCFDYSWLAIQCEGLLKPGMKILDIGCGPGAIHGYLENKHGVEIIGLDTRKWEPDYIDIVGNFCEAQLRENYGLGDNQIDVIISSSAFEHNTKEDHKILIDTCMRSLKPGGVLLTTFSCGKVFSIEESAHQWNLPQVDLEEIYGVKFESYEYDAIRERWRIHREVPHAYKARYGKWTNADPYFLAAGVCLVKPL